MKHTATIALAALLLAAPALAGGWAPASEGVYAAAAAVTNLTYGKSVRVIAVSVPAGTTNQVTISHITAGGTTNVLLAGANGEAVTNSVAWYGMLRWARNGVIRFTCSPASSTNRYLICPYAE